MVQAAVLMKAEGRRQKAEGRIKNFSILPSAFCLLFLALTACATSHDGRHANTTEAIIEREQELTLALTQHKYGVVNDMLADDFRCAVAGSRWFNDRYRESSRRLVCTGVGYGMSRLAERPKWLRATEKQMPRWATIEDIDVTLDDGKAVVVSLQTYTNWFP